MGFGGVPTSKLVSVSFLPPFCRVPLRRPVVTWLGGAVFNPLVLGYHVWGKKRRDGHGSGRDSRGRLAARDGGLYQETLFASCLGLLKNFLIAHRHFPPSHWKFHPPSLRSSRALEILLKEISSVREVTVARLFSAIIGESLWRWSLLSVGIVVKLFGNSLIFVSSVGSWLIFNPLLRISSNLYFWGDPFRYFNQNVRIYILKGVNCWYGLDKRIHQLNWKLVDSNLFPHRPIIRLGLFPV